MASTVILINRNGMGAAPAELQQTLIKNYFVLLAKDHYIPDAICFYGEGVELTCDGSAVIADLKLLETKGTKLIICKTCLHYFLLQDRIQVGMVGTMHDIIDMQFTASKVITL